MCIEQTDTIVASATPAGRGGIAVVRLSGPLVKKIAKTLLKKFPTPRYATCSLFLDSAGQTIDEGIALFFPSPHSFTGEDVLELQGHGGPIVVNSLIRQIVSLGARLARPGEFSERAFLNNKIDLTQAEAIADLIDASSEQAARSATRSLQGEFSKKIHELVDLLIQLRTYIEAAIDFTEEEIDFLADREVEIRLKNIMQLLHQVQASAVQGSLLREGITAVIAGCPNVGKSSLLNQLSGKESAIVTEIAGTTRDLLRESILIDGMPMYVIDTAGLRESNDIVEKEGIRRAREEIAKAEIVLFVVDARDENSANTDAILQKMSLQATMITIRNKIDLTKEPASLIEQEGRAIISLSAKNGTGVNLLKNHIKVSVGLQTTGEGLFSARRRHVDALDRAEVLLAEAHHSLHDKRAPELLAEDLRQVQLALSEITGKFTSDDLLGKIFSSFCIGK